MAVISSRPSPPGRTNPSTASVRRCHSRTEPLECPDEFAGVWGGPAYATLGRDPVNKRPAIDAPFLDPDESIQRPAWQATLALLRHDQRLRDLPLPLRDHGDAVHFIPHWRLTELQRDLKAELLERPLLSVFRFVQFSTYFLASPRCDTKFVRVTSDVYLCGQVIAYSTASRMSLVDDTDLLVVPSSGSVCHVAYADELHRLVAISLEDVRVCHIRQAEYLLGYYHQLPVGMAPSGFDAVSAAIDLPPGQPASEAVKRIASDLVVPGSPPLSTVDSRPRSVAYITPRGEKTASTILANVQDNKLPPPKAEDGAVTGIDSPPPVLPLLSREDAILSPSDVFGDPTRSGCIPGCRCY